MSSAQLELVLELRQREEQDALDMLQQAKQQVLLAQQKMTQLEQYREQYLQQISAENTQHSAQQIRQYQGFIGKLDQACDAQTKQFSDAVLVKEQRQAQWRQAQQKTHAMHKLLEQKRRDATQTRLRKEQKNHDDFALQRLLQSRK